jgi:hypothetical protein
MNPCAWLAHAQDITPTGADEPIHRVPTNFPTIQAAIDAAENGDTVLVAPGVYRESLRLGGKTIVLASHFLTSGDAKYIVDTILEGTRTAENGVRERFDQVILVESTVGPDSKITGFTIRGGDDGISCHGSLAITNNHFVGNEDAIDYEGGGGLCRHNLFEENMDDAVDFDLATAAEVSHNIMRNNHDDGIEIRLHDHQGEQLDIIICNNMITGNGEDGIQIIGYPRRSNRRILIERNLIARNAMAGIGCMANGITRENYEGAGIPEPILVVNNTIAENEYGVTGGHNLGAVNNVFLANRVVAMKDVDGHSYARNNLFWNNGVDAHQSCVKADSKLSVDPQLDGEYRPRAGSPCISAAVEELDAPWGPYELDPATISGEAPDLGAFEFEAQEAE